MAFLLASSAPPKIGPSRRIQVSIGTISGCFEPLSLCPFPPRPKDAHVSERDCVVCGGVFGLPIGLVYYRLPARLVCQLSMRPQPHDRDESQATSTSAYVIPTGVIRIPNIAIAGRGATGTLVYSSLGSQNAQRLGFIREFPCGVPRTRVTCDRVLGDLLWFKRPEKLPNESRGGVPRSRRPFCWMPLLYSSETSRKAPHSYHFTRHKTRFSRKAPRDSFIRLHRFVWTAGHAPARELPIPRRRTGDGHAAEPQRRCAGKGE